MPQKQFSPCSQEFVSFLSTFKREICDRNKSLFNCFCCWQLLQLLQRKDQQLTHMYMSSLMRVLTSYAFFELCVVPLTWNPCVLLCLDFQCIQSHNVIRFCLCGFFRDLFLDLSRKFFSFLLLTQNGFFTYFLLLLFPLTVSWKTG